MVTPQKWKIHEVTLLNISFITKARIITLENLLEQTFNSRPDSALRENTFF